MKYLIVFYLAVTSLTLSGQQSQFETHEGIVSQLFASEPMVQDPSAMDIDEKGRVWVTEIVNYRRSKGLRKEGDRVVILEDTDGDGKADKSTVFYQDPSFMSPHGICVVGPGKVIVSVGDEVLKLTDTNGDLKADTKEVMFSKIGGAQHDHGIHAFVQGADGRLYFNHGNASRQICDKNGKVVIDKSGREVKASGKPYRQGMVFRCEQDGSNFETLAWDFRNNWDLAVDSFGTIWQSDNDDDGNQGCHVNYVMEFGAYGYKSGVNGAGWRSYRHSMHENRGYHHFHQNDPGVIPYLYHYGAGGPTGIMVYEGSLLPSALNNQIIHCEPRVMSVRAYPRKDSGAGYSASMVNVMETEDKMFRPSDVVTAPDGSVFVSDWYDSGVGGHGARSLKTGKIYRLAPKGSKYTAFSYDFSTAQGAVKALQSPNKATYFQAHNALVEMGEKAKPEVAKLFDSADSVFRARALWILIKLDKNYIQKTLQNPDHNLRIVAVRAARQHGKADAGFIAKVSKDKNPQVRREACLALRELKGAEAASLWAQLAIQYDGADRWYVEALGIAADGRWDECLKAWLALTPDIKSNSFMNIMWRSRSTAHSKYITSLISDKARSEADIRRLFRSVDFLLDKEFDRGAFYSSLIDKSHPQNDLIVSLVLRSISNVDTKKYPKLDDLITNQIGKLIGTKQFVDMTVEANLKSCYGGLFEMCYKEKYQAMASYAATGYVKLRNYRSIDKDVENLSATEKLRFIYALSNSKERGVAEALLQLLRKVKLNASETAAAASGAVKANRGAFETARAVQKEGSFSDDIRRQLVLNIHSFKDKRAKDMTQKLYEKYKASVPAKIGKYDIAALVKKKGDAAKGQLVYNSFCITCHQNGKTGFDFGPALSDIGKKLGRDVMFQAILEPSAAVSFDYAGTKVTMKDKTEVTGIAVGKTETHLTLKLMGGSQMKYDLKKIAKTEQLKISLMPNIFGQALKEEQLVDLVEYLMSLK